MLFRSGLLDPGDEVVHRIPPYRHAWLQVARGSVLANGNLLEQGDGAAVSHEDQLVITGKDRAEVLVFELT